LGGHANPEDTRRRLGGLSLIVAPLLLAAGELLRLWTGSDGADLEVAGLTNDGRGVWIAVGTLEVVGVIVAFPALIAFLHVFTRRAASLGHLAVGLLATALVCQAAYAGLLAAANGAAARLTRDGDIDAGDIFTTLLYANTLETPLALLALVAQATLLIGLLALTDAVRRSKLFPRWTAAASAVAAVLTLVVDFGLPYVLLAPAWAWMGWTILRMPTREWERLREPTRLADSDAVAT
jgi:hypothetical protein